MRLQDVPANSQAEEELENRNKDEWPRERVTEVLRTEFKPEHWEIFWRTVHGESPADVARPPACRSGASTKSELAFCFACDRKWTGVSASRARAQLQPRSSVSISSNVGLSLQSSALPHAVQCDTPNAIGSPQW